MKRMSANMKVAMFFLLRAGAVRRDSWTTNWAWQATGIKSDFIGAVINAAHARGLICTCSAGTWAVTHHGQEWLARNANWKRPKKTPMKKPPKPLTRSKIKTRALNLWRRRPESNVGNCFYEAMRDLHCAAYLAGYLAGRRAGRKERGK